MCRILHFEERLRRRGGHIWLSLETLVQQGFSLPGVTSSSSGGFGRGSASSHIQERGRTWVRSSSVLDPSTRAALSAGRLFSANLSCPANASLEMRPRTWGRFFVCGSIQ